MTGSEITGNFYNLMFTSILGLTEITEIISDKSLSPGAIKSYNNLSQNGLLSLYVITPTEYIEYSKDSLLNNPLNRVSVKQTKDANINEIFKEAFIIPYSLKLFIDKNDIFNNRIYCESNVY